MNASLLSTGQEMLRTTFLFCATVFAREGARDNIAPGSARGFRIGQLSGALAKAGATGSDVAAAFAAAPLAEATS